MANRLPLVFDPTESKIKELPTGDNLSLTGSSIVDGINITVTGTVTTNTLNVQNLNATGGNIAAVAFSNDYNDLDNLPSLFSGDYNDLVNKPTAISSDWADITNKPIIPSTLSQLVNDTNFITNASAAITPNQVIGIAQVAKTNNYADLTNKPDLSVYVRTADLVGGTLTIDVNNTGDLVGSVFAENLTLLVDHINGKINLGGGPVDDFLDIGSADSRFSNVYISDSINIDGAIIGGGSQTTISLTGVAIRPTGNALSQLEADLDVLQTQYDEAYESWLNIPPNPPEPRQEFYDSTIAPILEAIAAQEGLLASRAIVSYDPNSSKIISDTPFSGVFDGEFVGSVFADDSRLILDGITGTLYGRLDGDMTGSVFSDDSTIIVDGINKSIHATNVYATTHWGDLSKNGSILSVTANNGIQLLPNGVFNVPNATTIDIDATDAINISATGNLVLETLSGNLEIYGIGLSISNDGAGTVISEINGNISIEATSGSVIIDGHISIADLQTLITSCNTFEEFKTAILDLIP